jgi:thiaminase
MVAKLGTKRLDKLMTRKNTPLSNSIKYYKSKEFRKIIKQKMEALDG